jgi:hypothetical protein
MNGQRKFDILHNRILFSHREEWNYVIYRKIDGNGDHHVNPNKPDPEWKISHFLSYVEYRQNMNVIVGLFGGAE